MVVFYFSSDRLSKREQKIVVFYIISYLLGIDGLIPIGYTNDFIQTTLHIVFLMLIGGWKSQEYVSVSNIKILNRNIALQLKRTEHVSQLA